MQAHACTCMGTHRPRLRLDKVMTHYICFLNVCYMNVLDHSDTEDVQMSSEVTIENIIKN